MIIRDAVDVIELKEVERSSSARGLPTYQVMFFGRPVMQLPPVGSVYWGAVPSPVGDKINEFGELQVIGSRLDELAATVNRLNDEWRELIRHTIYERELYCIGDGCEAVATNLVIESESGAAEFQLCFSCATVYEWGYNAGGGEGEATVPIDEYEPDFFPTVTGHLIERLGVWDVARFKDAGPVTVCMKAVGPREIEVPAADAGDFLKWYYRE